MFRLENQHGRSQARLSPICRRSIWALCTKWPEAFLGPPSLTRHSSNAAPRASQVFGQWLNNEEQIQTAIEACPVSCIHWVARADLPVLEHIMAKVRRTPSAPHEIASAQPGRRAPGVLRAAGRTSHRTLHWQFSAHHNRLGRFQG